MQFFKLSGLVVFEFQSTMCPQLHFGDQLDSGVGAKKKRWKWFALNGNVLFYCSVLLKHQTSRSITACDAWLIKQPCFSWKQTSGVSQVCTSKSCHLVSHKHNPRWVKTLDGVQPDFSHDTHFSHVEAGTCHQLEKSQSVLHYFFGEVNTEDKSVEVVWLIATVF